MTRLWNFPAKTVAEITAQLSVIAEAKSVGIVILDPDWNYIGFDLIPAPLGEEVNTEAAEVITWLNDDSTELESELNSWIAEERNGIPDELPDWMDERNSRPFPY